MSEQTQKRPTGDPVLREIADHLAVIKRYVTVGTIVFMLAMIFLVLTIVANTGR